MATGRAIAINKPSREAPGFAETLAALLHDIKRSLFDPYRPELHYMRGPGPKWRERHPEGR
jgi:hypothetical protein